MKINELKEYLVSKNLVVEQWELTIISLIKEQEKLFETSSEKINGNAKSRKIFEKRLSKKAKAFGNSVEELTQYTNDIRDMENMSMEELERRGEQLIASFENSKNFWTLKDKNNFNTIYSEFIEIKKNITITNRISNFFLKYEFTKTLVQLLIFTVSFIFSYFGGQALEPYFTHFNDITIQFFIALILFLTLEKVLDKFEDYLVYWRVNRLFKYFRIIMPLTQRLKNNNN
ncbi:putative PurR-regulated permease PerM [Flavobacterium gossypii]|uniref:PurR-regulated permease PerM n=1 Tax=Flavobacterium gossypii TaxID=1646119 RepID=A0ABR6DRG8_9FLAO|nr:hypothetical protein [Flavobacterium gossypii]MBA9074282.1 putative PurR-regulated permease PerM [Flavobacterium gossypii]